MASSSFLAAAVLSCSLVLCFLGAATAVNSNTNKTAAVIKQFLDAHNAARLAVRVPPLTWEPNLAKFAHVYSVQRRGDCELVHSPGFLFGENIFWGQGRLWKAKDAVAAWVAEKAFYNYERNSCSIDDCSHYTQIVWRNTIRVGCAQIICNSGDTFVTCEYYPPGNYVGARPY